MRHKSSRMALMRRAGVFVCDSVFLREVQSLSLRMISSRRGPLEIIVIGNPITNEKIKQLMYDHMK